MKVLIKKNPAEKELMLRSDSSPLNRRLGCAGDQYGPYMELDRNER